MMQQEQKKWSLTDTHTCSASRRDHCSACTTAIGLKVISSMSNVSSLNKTEMFFHLLCFDLNLGGVLKCCTSGGSIFCQRICATNELLTVEHFVSVTANCSGVINESHNEVKIADCNLYCYSQWSPGYL